MDKESKQKIILSNIPAKDFDEENIKLLFESPKYLGKYRHGYEIIDFKYHRVKDHVLVILNYGDENAVDAVLKNTKITFKKIEYIPMAFNTQIVDEFLSCQTKSEPSKHDKILNESTKSNHMNFKIGKENKQNTLNQKQVDESKKATIKYSSHEKEKESNQLVYTHKVESYKYPFYLLKFDCYKTLLASLQNQLKDDLSANFSLDNTGDFYITRATFPKEKFLNRKENLDAIHSDWLAKVETYLNQFSKMHFSQYVLPIGDRNMWVYMRQKAIDYYANSEKINLIYTMNPSSNYIRLDGESSLIEIEKKKLLVDMSNYFKISKVIEGKS